MILQNPAERLVYRTLVLTWPFYGIGALFIVGPVLAWIIGAMAVVSLYLGDAMRTDLRATGPVPMVVWAWIIGMLAMLVVLWVGHLNWGLGLTHTIKSSIGWAKGWALLALFPLAGAVLPIRRAVLVRGQCVVGLCTLLVAPLLISAPYLGLEERIYTSPLKFVGGPGPEYFSVFFFSFDPASGTPRWQYFAPWSPFAALIGVVMVLFALEDRNFKWRCIGIGAGILMILTSKSRMGLVGLVVCTIGPRMVPLILRSYAWQIGAACTPAIAVVGPALGALSHDAISSFKGARANSTRVRETLQRIASERWQNEAYWFGHGAVQPGSHLVEYMPIGSHHTWFGLLFVKGVFGLLALLVPFVWQIVIALVDCAKNPRGRLPLGIMLTLILLSFGENLEVEVYLLWPALLMLGIHAREITGR